jgi:alkanesulfonate monooxygenase SsuD/methylene tetrahydromethanopterin reductase-like flavin-dependent oxidoreductase (luciferase family)
VPAVDVGIGLPNTIRGVDGAAILEWARRAEAAGFSSLGTLDRLVYGNCEALVTLAAAGAVTERIRLVTDILIAPLRGTALLAKQAATVDLLSGGRLVLGLAVGGREDDYAAAEADFAGRGRTFDRQLEEMARIWRGEAGIGPAPARGERPRLLIGGQTDRALRRATRYADGFTMGGGPPEALRELVPRVRGAWEAAGREDRPRVMALFYFSLGEGAEEAAKQNLGDYYAFVGPYADQVVARAAKDAETVRRYVDGFADAGADEVIAFPASPDPAQVDLLAEAALRR